MGGFSNYLETKLLDVIFGKATYTSPNIWVALCKSLVSDLDTGATIAEITGANYARVNVVASSWSSSATTGATSNVDTISWATASDAWGTITHTAICDASTAGNVLCYASVADAKTVASGDQVQFAAGAFDVIIS